MLMAVRLPAGWLWASRQQGGRRMVKTWGTLQYFSILGTLSNLVQSVRKGLLGFQDLYIILSLGWDNCYLKIALALGHKKAWSRSQRRPGLSPKLD